MSTALLQVTGLKSGYGAVEVLRRWSGVWRARPVAVVAAPAFGAASGAIGLTVSAEWDISAGAAIALTSAALFLLTWMVSTATQQVGRRAAVAARRVGAPVVYVTDERRRDGIGAPRTSMVKMSPCRFV